MTDSDGRSRWPAIRESVGLVVLAACVVVVVGGLASLQPALFRGVSLTWDHVTTTARVLDTGRSPSRYRRDSFWADLAFDAEGRPIRTRLFLTGRQPTVGDDLTIDYLPSNPRTVRVAGQFWSDEVKAAAAELGVPALAVGTVVVALKGGGRKRQRSGRGTNGVSGLPT
jgi:hypothetical protein